MTRWTHFHSVIVGGLAGASIVHSPGLVAGCLLAAAGVGFMFGRFVRFAGNVARRVGR
jgi:hypothetical protein